MADEQRRGGGDRQGTPAGQACRRQQPRRRGPRGPASRSPRPVVRRGRWSGRAVRSSASRAGDRATGGSTRGGSSSRRSGDRASRCFDGSSVVRAAAAVRATGRVRAAAAAAAGRGASRKATGPVVARWRSRRRAVRERARPSAGAPPGGGRTRDGPSATTRGAIRDRRAQGRRGSARTPSTARDEDDPRPPRRRRADDAGEATRRAGRRPALRTVGAAARPGREAPDQPLAPAPRHRRAAPQARARRRPAGAGPARRAQRQPRPRTAHGRRRRLRQRPRAGDAAHPAPAPRAAARLAERARAHRPGPVPHRQLRRGGQGARGVRRADRRGRPAPRAHGLLPRPAPVAEGRGALAGAGRGVADRGARHRGPHRLRRRARRPGPVPRGARPAAQAGRADQEARASTTCASGTRSPTSRSAPATSPAPGSSSARGAQGRSGVRRRRRAPRAAASDELSHPRRRVVSRSFPAVFPVAAGPVAATAPPEEVDARPPAPSRPRQPPRPRRRRPAGREPGRALRPVLRRPAEIRVLESGTRLATLAVRCPGSGADDRATSVPVTVWDPPAWVETLDAGDVVVVVGRLRRRFYQRPGGVGSRVDVEAELDRSGTRPAPDRRRAAARPTSRARRARMSPTVHVVAVRLARVQVERRRPR